MNEEYYKMLEEYVDMLSTALIIDMMKKGIFEETSGDEVKLTSEFVEKVKKFMNSLEDEDVESKVIGGVLGALSEYYGDDMYEEEIVARANVILAYMGEEFLPEK